MQKPTKNRMFTVELKSKAHLKNLTLTNDGSDTVLLEGSIGEFIEASFKEGIILEVVGRGGVLRVDLSEGEIKKPQPQTSSAEKGA